MINKIDQHHYLRSTILCVHSHPDKNSLWLLDGFTVTTAGETFSLGLVRVSLMGLFCNISYIFLHLCYTKTHRSYRFKSSERYIT